MLRQLARREIDLCLITDPKDKSIEWVPLVTGEVWVMVPPGRPLEGRRMIALKELDGEPTILPRAGGPLRDVVDALYHDAGIDLNVVCESDDVSAMRGLVLAGLGLQFVPDLRQVLAVEADPLYMRLVDPQRSVQVGMACRRDGYRIWATQDFAAFAVAHVVN